MKLNGPLFNGQFGLVSVSKIYINIKKGQHNCFLEPYFDAGFQNFYDQLCWILLVDWDEKVKLVLLSDEPTTFVIN